MNPSSDFKFVESLSRCGKRTSISRKSEKVNVGLAFQFGVFRNKTVIEENLHYKFKRNVTAIIKVVSVQVDKKKTFVSVQEEKVVYRFLKLFKQESWNFDFFVSLATFFCVWKFVTPVLHIISFPKKYYQNKYGILIKKSTLVLRLDKTNLLYQKNLLSLLSNP